MCVRLTLHNTAPLFIFAVGAVGTYFCVDAAVARVSETGAQVGVAVGISVGWTLLCSVLSVAFVTKLFPTREFRPPKPALDGTEPRGAHERTPMLNAMDAVGGSGGGGAPFTIGMRQVPGDKLVGRPPCTIFYKADAGAKVTRIPWLPNGGDERYNHGLANFVVESLGGEDGWQRGCMYGFLVGAMQFMFRHWAENGLHAAHDAPLHLPRDAAAAGPITVFCHGMGAHAHVHSDYVMAHVATTTTNVVICPTFCDGSAGFAHWSPHDEVPFELGERMDVFSTTVPQRAVEQRQRQLAERVREVDALLRFIAADPAASADRNASLRGVLLQEQAVADDASWKRLIGAPSEITAEAGSGAPAAALSRVPVKLIGHSFGAATVVAVCMGRHRGVGCRDVQVKSALTLDVWGFPVKEFKRQLDETQRLRAGGHEDTSPCDAPVPPPLFIEDSQEWDSYPGKVNHHFVETILRAWDEEMGVHCARCWHAGTDHFTATDVRFLLPALRKSWVCASREECANAAWAHHKAAQCPELHTARADAVSPAKSGAGATPVAAARRQGAESAAAPATPAAGDGSRDEHEDETLRTEDVE
jgi:hypothetical protein